MKKQILVLSLLFTFGMLSNTKEYHVSMNGNDKGAGLESAPYFYKVAFFCLTYKF